MMNTPTDNEKAHAQPENSAKHGRKFTAAAGGRPTLDERGHIITANQAAAAIHARQDEIDAEKGGAA